MIILMKIVSVAYDLDNLVTLAATKKDDDDEGKTSDQINTKSDKVTVAVSFSRSFWCDTTFDMDILGLYP